MGLEFSIESLIPISLYWFLQLIQSCIEYRIYICILGQDSRWFLVLPLCTKILLRFWPFPLFLCFLGLGFCALLDISDNSFTIFEFLPI